MKTENEQNHAIENARAHVEGITEIMALIDKAGAESCHVEYEGSEYDYDGLCERAQEDALAVSVRGPWHTPGEYDNKPSEYLVLLSCGGPACRITGDLNQYGQPDSARVEWQDWGTPWTEYRDTTTEQDDAVVAFVRLFYFGE
jgi:hypothetical protein